MRHEIKQIRPRTQRQRELWRCSCGSEVHDADDAHEHAMNANADDAEQGRHA